MINKLSKPNHPFKCSLAHKYHVSEGAVRKVWAKIDEIEQHSLMMTAETRVYTFCQPKGHFLEIEDQLFTWIDTMRWMGITVVPSLAIAKAKQIAATLTISEDDFKIRCFV